MAGGMDVEEAAMDSSSLLQVDEAEPPSLIVWKSSSRSRAALFADSVVSGRAGAKFSHRSSDEAGIATPKLLFPRWTCGAQWTEILSSSLDTGAVVPIGRTERLNPPRPRAGAEA